MITSELSLKEGKHVLAAPCLEVVVFSHAHPDGNGARLASVVRAFADRFGNDMAFYRLGNWRGFRPAGPAMFDTVFEWFADERFLARKQQAFTAHAGNKKSAAVPALELTLWGFDDPPLFIFRMALPLEMAADPDPTLAFVRDAFAECPVHSGHCGFSFFWTTLDERAICAWAAPLMLRHPGLGFGNPVVLSNATCDGVVAVSWLTLLGKGIAADLGGRVALERRLAKDVSIEDLGDGGLLLRAGYAPSLDDVGAYRAVGSLVAPRRTTDAELDDLVIAGMTEDDAKRWLRRFFV